MRPTFYKSDMGIGVRLHDLKDEFCMFVMAYEPYVKNDTNAHVTVSSWRRVDDNVIPARGKVAGAYANSALIKTDANRLSVPSPHDVALSQLPLSTCCSQLGPVAGTLSIPKGSIGFISA